jgi:hypothetical protein
MELNYDIGDKVYATTFRRGISRKKCKLCRGTGRVDVVGYVEKQAQCPLCFNGHILSDKSKRAVVGPFKVKGVSVNYAPGKKGWDVRSVDLSRIPYAEFQYSTAIEETYVYRTKKEALAAIKKLNSES